MRKNFIILFSSFVICTGRNKGEGGGFLCRTPFAKEKKHSGLGMQRGQEKKRKLVGCEIFVCIYTSDVFPRPEVFCQKLASDFCSNDL